MRLFSYCVTRNVQCAILLGRTRSPRTSAAHTTEGSNPRRPPAHPVGDRERTWRRSVPPGTVGAQRTPSREQPPAQQNCLVYRGWENYVSKGAVLLPTGQRSRRNSIRKGRKRVGLAAGTFRYGASFSSRQAVTL